MFGLDDYLNIWERLLLNYYTTTILQIYAAFICVQSSDTLHIVTKLAYTNLSRIWKEETSRNKISHCSDNSIFIVNNKGDLPKYGFGQASKKLGEITSWHFSSDKVGSGL